MSQIELCEKCIYRMLMRKENSKIHIFPIFCGTHKKQFFSAAYGDIKKAHFFLSRNRTANHRANDVLVKEGANQHIVAKFSYGLLDMGVLSGEKVDVHIMKDPPNGS